MARIDLSTATVVYKEFGARNITVWRVNGLSDGDEVNFSSAYSLVEGAVGLIASLTGAAFGLVTFPGNGFFTGWVPASHSLTGPRQTYVLTIGAGT